MRLEISRLAILFLVASVSCQLNNAGLTLDRGVSGQAGASSGRAGSGAAAGMTGEGGGDGYTTGVAGGGGGAADTGSGGVDAGDPGQLGTAGTAAEGGAGGIGAASGAGGDVAGAGGVGSGAGGADSSGSAGAGGVGGGGASGSAGAGGVGGAGGSSACQDATKVDRYCSMDSECVAVLHTINCCGAAAWIGIRKSADAHFTALESQCDASYPACGCPAGPPIADDGSVIPFGTAAGAECVLGQCKTFAPACGGSCSAGRSCLTCGTRPPKSACSLRCMTDDDCTSNVYTKCRVGPNGGICVPPNATCSP